MFIASASAAILQVLMGSPLLCTGAVGGFEPDSRWFVSTARVATWHVWTDSTVHVARWRSSSADAAGTLRGCKRPSAARVDVPRGAAARVGSVARWELFTLWGRRVALTLCWLCLICWTGDGFVLDVGHACWIRYGYWTSNACWMSDL